MTDQRSSSGSEDVNLRLLVDIVWNHATESTAVPSTKTADMLIAKYRQCFPDVAQAQPMPRGAMELAKNIIHGSLHAATRERNYAKAAEYQSYIDEITAALAAPQPPASAQEEREERLEEALQQVAQWADAYPLDVFPVPDWKKARALLEAGDLTLDSVSAHIMRHVIEGVGKIAKDALTAKNPAPGEPDAGRPTKMKPSQQ